MIGLRTCASCLALAGALAAPGTLHAADYRVSGTDNTPKVLTGSDTLTVDSGALLSSPTDPTVNQAGVATGVIVNNAGRIEAPNGRAFDTSGSGTPRTITINNVANATILGNDDAIRINSDIGAGVVTINNQGQISSIIGQGIDFDAIGSGGTVTINNFAGGVIRGSSDDALRPGTSTVNNAGAISSDGAAGSASDAIDTQGRVSTIVNFDGGSISGLRHGVAANGAVTVSNAATGVVLGRAGSGISAGGLATVTNFGAIAGFVDGVGGGGLNVQNAAGGGILGNTGRGLNTLGNGTVVNLGAISGALDGVRIGGVATVTNAGTIQGVGSAAATAAGGANGVRVGSGTVNNAAGGQIIGAANGIVADDGQGGNARGATTINNDGTIRGSNGAGIRLTGAFNDVVNNSGAIIGVNGPAISLGAGNDTLTLLTSSNIQGAIDGGDGTDGIVLSGGAANSVGTLGPTVNFETLSLQAGSWIVTGASTYSGGITVSAARLENRGTLLGATTVSSGEIVGGGTYGALSLSGANSGIRPGGTGTIGTITVNGNYAQTGQAIYFADLNAAGGSDRIVVGGTATLQNNAIIALTKAPGTYTVGTRFTVLTAAGGVNGTYGTVAADNDPLTLLRVSYGANAVFVDVLRNAASLNLAGTTPNQIAVAAALGTIDINSGLFSTVGSIASTPALTAVLDTLSGEAYASTHAALAQDARRVATAIATRIETAPSGSGGWLQGIVASGRADGARGAADLKQQAYGAVGGFDAFSVDRMRGGLALGYTHDKAEVDARGSRTESDAIQAALYGGGAFGQFNVRLVAGYSWVKLHTRRNVALPSPETVKASYNGSVIFGLAEASYAIPVGGFTLSPFALAQASHVNNDNATETGGVSALRVASGGEDITAVTGGLRVVGPQAGPVTVRASAGLRRIIGTNRPRITAAFGTGAAFSVYGASLPRYAGVGDIDLLYNVGERARIGVGYSGVVGSGGSDHATRVIFAVGL